MELELTPTSTTISQQDNAKIGNQKLGRFANKALKGSAQFWFAIATIGQWLFAFYVTLFYGGATLSGNLEKYNEVLPDGFIAGDTLGNIAVITHVLLAVIIIAGGPIQLIPKVRNKFPTFHRWLGRIYMPTAIIVAFTGVYMVWARQTAPLLQHMGITMNAVAILVCSYFALSNAIKRNLTVHRQWAIRLFLVTMGVWFFRVGLMFTLFLNQGPFGFDPATFQGPFITFLNWGQWLIPLAFTELYFRAQQSKNQKVKLAVAGTITFLALAIGLGIAIASMMMWLPRL